MNRNFNSMILGLTSAFLFSLSIAAHARPPEIAARPLGMGEAFLAVADDANALGWNPAGLPRLDRHELSGSRADLFNIGIHTNNLGYVFPLRDGSALGFDWKSLDSDDIGLRFKEDHFRFSYGHRLWDGLSLGLALRRIQTDMSLDGLAVAAGSGWGLDLAILASPLKRLNIALGVHDFSDTSVRYEDRGKGKIAKRRVRLGAAYRPWPELTLAADVDDRFHFGAEYWHKNTLALRAGLHQERHISDGPTYATGGSLRYQFFQFDYAYVVPPTLPASARFSVALFFNLYASKVRIAATPQLEPVFPAFARRYAGTQSLGRVKVVNQDDQPHQATLSFFIPGLMDAPAQKRIILPPKSVKEITVDTLIFSDKAVLTEPRLAPAQFKISYTAQQRTRTHTSQTHLFVYSRNHTQWDDLRKAAAFITPLDQTLEGFSRPILANFEPEINALGKATRNLLRAMLLFKAMQRHGIRYVPDPNNPYARMAADADAVDHILYPAELLHKKTGDCDDLTVLYCALLENTGVHTALVDYPGHIFMMFDSGVTYRNAYKLPVNQGLYLRRGDRLWIPVEITLLNRPFLDAWRAAAETLAALTDRERQRLVVDTASAWTAYEPSNPPHTDGVTPLMRQTLAPSFKEQYASLEKLIDAHLEHSYLEPLRNDPANTQRSMQLARVYVSIRQFDQAIAVYQGLLDKVVDPTPVHNNMAIAYFLNDKMKEAVEHFKMAAALQPDNQRIKQHLTKTLRLLEQSASIPPDAPQAQPTTGSGKAEARQTDEDSFYWMN